MINLVNAWIKKLKKIFKNKCFWLIITKVNLINLNQIVVKVKNQVTLNLLEKL